MRRNKRNRVCNFMSPSENKPLLFHMSCEKPWTGGGCCHGTRIRTKWNCRLNFRLPQNSRVVPQHHSCIFLPPQHRFNHVISLLTSQSCTRITHAFVFSPRLFRFRSRRRRRRRLLCAKLEQQIQKATTTLPLQ